LSYGAGGDGCWAEAIAGSRKMAQRARCGVSFGMVIHDSFAEIWRGDKSDCGDLSRESRGSPRGM